MDGWLASGMSTIPLRPLGFGEIVDGALQLYRRDFGVYYLIALLAAMPGYVLMLVTRTDVAMLALEDSADLLAVVGEMGTILGVLLFASVIAWVGTLAVAVAMVERIEERQVSVGGSYRGALRHLPRAAGATILATLLFGAFAGVIMFVAVATTALTLGAGIWVTFLGLAFLVLLGIGLVLFWLAATFGILPAVVIEGRGAIGALNRSLSLCRRGWLRVIGIMVVAWLINLAPSFAVTTIFGFQDLFTSPDALGTVSARNQWLTNTANLLIGPLTTPFMVGSILVLFHDRRVRSEAYDLETLAGTMDAQ